MDYVGCQQEEGDKMSENNMCAWTCPLSAVIPVLRGLLKSCCFVSLSLLLAFSCHADTAPNIILFSPVSNGYASSTPPVAVDIGPVTISCNIQVWCASTDIGTLYPNVTYNGLATFNGYTNGFVSFGVGAAVPGVNKSAIGWSSTAAGPLQAQDIFLVPTEDSYEYVCSASCSDWMARLAFSSTRDGQLCADMPIISGEHPASHQARTEYGTYICDLVTGPWFDGGPEDFQVGLHLRLRTYIANTASLTPGTHPLNIPPLWLVVGPVTTSIPIPVPSSIVVVSGLMCTITTDIGATSAVIDFGNVSAAGPYNAQGLDLSPKVATLQLKTSCSGTNGSGSDIQMGYTLTGTGGSSADPVSLYRLRGDSSQTGFYMMFSGTGSTDCSEGGKIRVDGSDILNSVKVHNNEAMTPGNATTTPLMAVLCHINGSGQTQAPDTYSMHFTVNMVGY